MDQIRWTSERPQLRRPVLLLAFEGWNDAGDAASTAARHIGKHFSASPFADLDPEEFYDFTESRPSVELRANRRHLRWPSNRFSAAKLAALDHDLIVGVGVEPQLRWKSYTQQVVELSKSLDCSLVITMGALIADVPHSRPTTIYGSTDEPQLARRLDLEPSTYEGPTGIVGVIHNSLRDHGLESASLWAAVPSYVPHAPSPKAALALVERFAGVIGAPVPGGSLLEATSDYEEQISELVEEDIETKAYVSQLESQYDSTTPESSAELIEELERFLEDQ